jgi:hypothetical protein
MVSIPIEQFDLTSPPQVFRLPMARGIGELSGANRLDTPQDLTAAEHFSGMDAALGIDGDPIGKSSSDIHPIAPTAICLHQFGCSCQPSGTATAIATTQVFHLVQSE